MRKKEAIAPVCVEAREYIPMPPLNEGQYFRVHPSGDYAILSTLEGVKILDFSQVNSDSQRKVRVLPTPLDFEVTPVEGGWEFIGATKTRAGEDFEGTRYWRWSDLLEKGNEAEYVFTEPEFDMVYETAAIRKLANGKTALVQNNFDEIRISTFDQDSGSFDFSAPSMPTCVAPNDPSLIKIHELQSKVSQHIDKSIGSIAVRSSPELDRLYTQIGRLREELAEQGYGLDNPMLSKDGKELAGLVSYEEPLPDGFDITKLDSIIQYGGKSYSQRKSLAIFQISDDGICSKVDQFDFQTSKVVFSSPKEGRKGRLAYYIDDPYTSKFTHKGKDFYEYGFGETAVVFDRDLNRSFMISTKEEHVLGFPGFSDSGLVIYHARIRSKDYIVRVDAERIISAGAECVHIEPESTKSKGTDANSGNSEVK